MTLTITDIFAGAGGSTSGAVMVPGVDVRVAANHWQMAVDVHQINHPTTDHACVDLHLEDPRNFPSTDVLWASPECTKWSQARGKTEALSAELGGDQTLFDEVPEDLMTTETDEITRSRLLMFDVLRFVEHHRYRAVVVENVVDVATQPKYARAWQLWLAGFRRLGYSLRVVSHNAMHAQAYGPPAPQSRDRLYVVAWRHGERTPDVDAVMRPSAWCTRCDTVVESVQAWKPGRTVGKYRVQYVYACSRCGTTVTPGWLPAAAAIDWTLPGHRIGDRAKPLADKTRARIAAGIARYWRPFALEAAGNTYDAADPKHVSYRDPAGYYRAWPVNEPLKSLHTTASKALAVPLRTHGTAATTDEPLKTFVVGNVGQALVTEHRFEYRTRPASEALPTVTASGNHLGLVTRHYGIPGGDPARHTTPSDEPLRTLTGNGGNMSLLTPFIAELRGGGSTARPTDHPLATVSAQGNHHALVSPYYGTADTARPTDDPLGTLTTRDRYALVMRNNGGGAEMTTPVAEYLRTLTTAGHQSLVTPADVETARAQVDDCLFRMLEPHEVAAGMAFPLDYQWLGTRRDRVKLAGNAVCPPAARDLITAVAEALGDAA